MKIYIKDIMSYIIRCTNNNLLNIGYQWWFQYYSPGIRYLTVEQTINSSIILNYHITNSSNIPVSNINVHLIIGKAYSGSNAIVSYNGITTSGIDNNTDQLVVTKNTDNNGNVSFSILGSLIIDKYTQVCAYVNDPGNDIVDIIDIKYTKYQEPKKNLEYLQFGNQFNIQTSKIKIDQRLNIFAYNYKINYNLYNFISSNPKIATINNLGIIIPKSKGKFYIVVTDKNGVILYTIPLFINII
jgi:hypothetical protein